MKSTQFSPGLSGNPGGRPKALVDIQALARACTMSNLDRLKYWRDQNEDPQVSLRATIALHEIAWGKPGQAMVIKADLHHQNNDSVSALLLRIRNSRPGSSNGPIIAGAIA